MAGPIMGIKATRRDFVLDVGSGGHPHSTADILVERFIEDDIGHRSHTRIVHDRPLVCADIANLPFADKSFDYVICNHVVEHVDDPAQALAELSRVGKRGYLGVPTEFYEFLCPSPTHKWVFALKGDHLVFKRLQEHHHLGEKMYGGLFFDLYRLPEFARFVRSRGSLFGIGIEWNDSISFRQAGDEEPFYDYRDPESLQPLTGRNPAGKCHRQAENVDPRPFPVRFCGQARAGARVRSPVVK